MSRRLAWAGLALTLLLIVPSALAEHPDGENPETFAHLNLDVQELAPGASISHHLLSPEGPLREGWIYIIYGGIQGEGHVIVNLTHQGETTDRFVWTGGAFHKNSTKIQGTGDHDLVLWNPTNETLRYAFYYDQSCNCAGKLIPLHGGFVLFNHKFEAGREVHHDLFVYDEKITLKAALATYDPDQETARWPQDFGVMDERTVSGKGWINFTFTPDQTQTYYVFYEALEGASPDDPVQLTPLIDVEKDVVQAPAPLMLPFLGLLLVGLALRRRS